MEDQSFNSWMAGFWEGEGSIHRKKARYSYCVSIGQSFRDDRLIEQCFKKIKKNFKGNYYFYSERGKTIIKWQLTKRKDVIDFIKAICPYCHLRKRQLEDVLNDYKIYPIKSYKDVDIRKAKELKQEGKTYREIAKILGECVSNIWRRLNELRYEIQKKKYYEEVDRKRKKDKYYNLKKELSKEINKLNRGI